MSGGGGLVYIVDDDPSVRKALGRLLRACGHRVEVFATAGEFMASPRADGPACLVLDVKMPGPSGLDLQEALAAKGGELPIIFLTGHGDVPMTARAMKAGAVDFLTKPVQRRDLLDAIRRALARHLQARADRAERHALEARLATLTPREREVFALVARGLPNKQIAAELRISEPTVKVHRGRVMRKMQADSLAELVRLAGRLNLPQVRLPAGPAEQTLQGS
jgi:RNA polymerase sigma factor (sigma-70 family)